MSESDLGGTFVNASEDFGDSTHKNAATNPTIVTKTLREELLPVILRNGGVGERLKPAVLKTVRPERVSGVQIPPPPPPNAK
jgi:hypothetical protein